MVSTERKDGYALASLLCSIIGFFGAPFVGSVLGIWFGYRARKRIAGDPARGGAEMAAAGMALGWAALMLWTTLVIVIAAVVRRIHLD